MNLKKITIIVSLSVLALNVNAQDFNSFYFEINLANQLAQNNKTENAITAYENAFKKVDYVHTKHLKKILKLAKKNKDTKRINYYSEKIETQLTPKDFKSAKIIDSLFVLDQQIRMEKRNWRANNYYRKCIENSSCNKTSKKFLKSQNLYNIYSTIDSSNVHRLLKLIDKNGYLGEEQIGSSSQKMEIILLHFDKDTTNQILQPILKNALLEGKIHPILFAQIQDRHLYNHNETQIYWTWPCSSKSKKLFSKSEVPQILKRRERIGIYDSSLSQKQKRKWYTLKNKFNS